jgi:hypothetical protein
VSDNLSVSYTDRNLTNDTTYYYTAFTRDFAGNWSGPATAVGTPVPAAATTLAISSSARAVAYKGEVVLTGKLLTSAGVVPESKTVTVQRSTDGGVTWKNDGTAAYDAVSKRYKATRFLTANSTFRLQFGGDPYYSAASSPQVSVKARAYLSQPVVPTGVKKNVAFTVSGYLEPLHAESTRLHFYYYEDGAYRPYQTVDVPNVKHDFDTAKYALRYKLPYAGKWQVKAYHADASHAPTWSPAKNFVVKQ